MHWSAEPGWWYWSISWAEVALVIPLHVAVLRWTLSNEECNSSIQVNSSSLHRGSKSKYYDHLVKVDNTASCTITFRPLIEIWLDRGVLVYGTFSRRLLLYLLFCSPIFRCRHPYKEYTFRRCTKNDPGCTEELQWAKVHLDKKISSSPMEQWHLTSPTKIFWMQVLSEQVNWMEQD